MARCGCRSQPTCNCTLEVDDTLSLTGSGNVDNPWELSISKTSWATLTGTYVNSYSAYAGTTYHVPQWRNVIGDMVQLRGRILKTGSFVSGETIISGIPTAIRPARNKILLVGSGATSGDNGQIEITPAGVITSLSTLPDSFIQLDGLWYEVVA